MAWRLLFVSAVLGLLAPVAYAQLGIPSTVAPGALGHQDSEIAHHYLRRHARHKIHVPVISVSPHHPQRLPAAGGVHFVLRAVIFTPSHFLTAAELDAVIRPYLQRAVDFRDLGLIVRHIDALYEKAGVLTGRAILPPQTIHKGIVHIDLIEGHIGQVVVSGNHYTKTGTIIRSLGLHPGAVVNVKTLRQALINYNRNNPDQVNAALRPGASFGLTNIELLTQQPPRYTAEIFGDNEGVASTGRYEGGVYLGDRSLFGFNDNLTLYALASDGSTYGYAAYDMPVTNAGGRVGISFDRSQIAIVRGPYQAIDITGHSWTAALNYTQPLLSTTHWQLNGVGSLTDTESVTRIGGVSLGRTDAPGASLGEDLHYYGTGTLVDFESALAYDLASVPLTPERHLEIVTGEASWLQAISGPWSTLMRVGWQWSPQANLPSVTLYQLGGAENLRGYDQGLVAGDGGYTVTGEVRRTVTPWLTALAFVDQGSVFSPHPAVLTLTDVGIGAQWQWRSWLSGSLSVAYANHEVVPGQRPYQVFARIVINPAAFL
ncbi:MAG: ShlB/FhaC/HecB family hemolysin secretion/activation protein [Acidiferrobacter sp.]